MACFAGYGFNKSHSAPKWPGHLPDRVPKTPLPRRVLAALLTCGKDDTDKVSRYVAEVRDSGIGGAAPCVNQSQMNFSSSRPTSIPRRRPSSSTGHPLGLSAVRGVGEGAVESLLTARSERAPDSLLTCVSA